MVWLALTPGSLVPTTDLAKATRVPGHYLAKVLQQLAGARLITGRRGVGGGYQLARPAAEITLRQVVAAVMPLERITACPMGVQCESLCDLHRLLDSLTADVLRALDGKTVADLAGAGGPGAPLCGATPDGKLAGVTVTRDIAN